MPWIPRMKYAFLGCTLETGSRIIGLLYMVVYAMSFLVFFFYYAIPYPDDMFDSDHRENASIHLELNNASTELFDSNATHQYAHEFAPLDIQSTFFLEESAFAQIVFGGILLYGIKLKNPDIVFSWILLQLALIWHSQLIFLLNLILAIHINTAYVLGFITEETVIITIELYCIVVVYNYILVLRNQGLRSSRDF